MKKLKAGKEYSYSDMDNIHGANDRGKSPIKTGISKRKIPLKLMLY
jgi:hypothetical protein